MVKLYEHESKDMFDSYSIPTPKRALVMSANDAWRAARALPTKDVVLKAQVLSGKRGKAGAIRIMDKSKAKKAASTMLRARVHGEMPAGVLVEEKIAIGRELYLAVTVDAATRSRIVLFSKQGGMDIEALAKEHPHAVIKEQIRGTAVPARIRSLAASLPRPREILGIIKRLIVLAIKEDATLAEINPLALTTAGYVALDAKVVVDENAIFRHPEHAGRATDLCPTEKKAKKAGLHYVDLDGDIAVIGNGAGLVMATLDMIGSHGGRPANFLDVQGGTGSDVMEKAVGLCLAKPGVKGLFVNIFAGITDCEEIAKGIIAYKRKHRIRRPIVVRMTGTHETAAKAMLKRSGVHLASAMDKGAKRIIKRVNA